MTLVVGLDFRRYNLLVEKCEKVSNKQNTFLLKFSLKEMNDFASQMLYIGLSTMYIFVWGGLKYAIFIWGCLKLILYWWSPNFHFSYGGRVKKRILVCGLKMAILHCLESIKFQIFYTPSNFSWNGPYIITDTIIKIKISIDKVLLYEYWQCNLTPWPRFKWHISTSTITEPVLLNAQIRVARWL